MEIKCQICSELIDKSDREELVCGHLYHNECIKKWFDLKKDTIDYAICPIPYCRRSCRQNIKGINLRSKKLPFEGQCIAITLKGDRCSKHSYGTFSEKVQPKTSLESGYCITHLAKMVNKCKGITKTGDNCKNCVVFNGDGYCRMHKQKPQD